MQVPGFWSEENNQAWPKKLQLLKIANVPFKVFW